MNIAVSIMDLMIMAGIALGASGLLVGCLLAILAEEEIRGMAHHLDLARIVLFCFIAIGCGLIIAHWAGGVLIILMLIAFLALRDHPMSNALAPGMLALALLSRNSSISAHLVSLVFLFGLPAGTLFVYKEGITKVHHAMQKAVAVHGLYIVGILAIAGITTSLF